MIQLQGSSKFDAEERVASGRCGVGCFGASATGENPGDARAGYRASLAVDGANRPEVKVSTVAGDGYAKA